jgi:hypothetical protein
MDELIRMVYIMIGIGILALIAIAFGLGALIF